VIEDFARLWAIEVTKGSFVSGGRRQAREILTPVTRELAELLATARPDLKAARRIGAVLVEADLATPTALEGTVRLLTGPSLVVLMEGAELAGSADSAGPGAVHRMNTGRVAEVVGALVGGFAEALRRRALDGAERLNRAERVAWRDRQRGLEDRLQWALLHDPLTSLPNRAALIRHLRDTLAEARPDQRMGLCLVDLERFAAVNHSLGTDVGDELLRTVAARLSALAEARGHTVAHLGADSFVIVVEDTRGPEDVVKVADAVLHELPDPWQVDGHDIPVSARVGIVERTAAGADPAELIRAASMALGWARAGGTTEGRGGGPDAAAGADSPRGRWAVFDPRRNAVDVRRHEITNAMPGALERGDFTLDYQPLVRLGDGAIIAVEALARWRHPVHGAIGPAEFIPLAERIGLIGPLGRYLLRRACLEARAWDSDTTVVSVNLAVSQLREPGLLATVAAILDETGLDPRLLQLEITEEAVVDPHDGSIETLHALARLGVGLAIDDFGTGFSSLAHLVDLPVHHVKLDGRFVQRLTDNGQRAATVLEGLIELGRRLRLGLVAEGVETAAQADALRGFGCQVGQGFHLGLPMTPDRLGALLRGGRGYPGGPPQ
jgi:diguanylate cyclase (GGDEF)-like protein